MVRFWAERADRAFLNPLMWAMLITLPISFVEPKAYLLGAALGLVLAFLNRRAFRFELTPTHLHLRGGVLTPSVLIPYSEIVDASAVVDRVPTEPGEAPIGTIVIKFPNGLGLPLKHMIDPVEVVRAIRQLKAGEAGKAGDASNERDA